MSLTAYLLQVPSWLSLSLITFSLLAFSCAGLWLTNRKWPIHERESFKEVAGFIYATIGVIFGVLIAFVVLIVWEQLNETKKNAEVESGVALALYRNASLYPDKAQSEDLKKQLQSIVRSILEEEYPAMQKMASSPPTFQLIEAFWQKLRDLEPKTAKENILYSQILKEMDEWAKLRSLRLQAAREELPGAVWISLIFGTLITIAFTFIFPCENRKVHYLMSGAVALLIAFVLYNIIELDHPFMGSVCVKPEGYELMLRIFTKG
ncbi:MAG: DUF4239 domain-containing protein [Candidatus Riflebacteria bacterium]|nr:DUF4239 domain-containing protein [Candidatus Riflebacteria bacterium]